MHATSFVSIAAAFSFALGVSCKKTPDPACEKLHDCCTAVTADKSGAGATEAGSLCKTFLGTYPRDPVTGDVPGKEFCEGIGPDIRKMTTKAGKTVPAACR